MVRRGAKWTGGALAVLAWVALPAAAAPLFDASDGEIGALADRIWQSGVRCTGWEPSHSPIVSISSSDLGWAQGAATFEGRVGLRSIRLDGGHVGGEALALPHELAHAWSYSRTSALAEGTAQVLAECIAQDLGMRAGTGPSLPEAVPDLRTWTPSSASPEERAAGYELARRLARARLLLFGGDSVWGPSAPTNLALLRRDLQARGPRGEALDRLLDRPEQLGAFLADADHDDVPDGVERMLSWDPDEWDSDGDGWWDGAEVADARRKVPLPATQEPVCLPDGAGWVHEDGPLVWSRGLERWTDEGWEPWVAERGVLPPARVIRRAADPRYWSGWGGRGGSWLRPTGKGEGLDGACVPGARLWVWSGDDLVSGERPAAG